MKSNLLSPSLTAIRLCVIAHYLPSLTEHHASLFNSTYKKAFLKNHFKIDPEAFRGRENYAKQEVMNTNN